MQSFALVPAAGRSLRMGRPKLLMPWGQSSVIEQVLRVWQTSAVTRVIVVVRPHDEPLAELCRAAGADVLVPATAPPEMKASVALGLHHIEQIYQPGPQDVWLLAPADMPLLSVPVITRLLAAHQSGQAAILVPTCQGKRGHPVLFPWSLAAEVPALGPDQGVNTLLTRHGFRTVACHEPGILEDLDTPDDYRRLHRS